jgi:hypothetical protein
MRGGAGHLRLCRFAQEQRLAELCGCNSGGMRQTIAFILTADHDK